MFLLVGLSPPWPLHPPESSSGSTDSTSLKLEFSLSQIFTASAWSKPNRAHPGTVRLNQAKDIVQRDRLRPNPASIENQKQAYVEGLREVQMRVFVELRRTAKSPGVTDVDQRPKRGPQPKTSQTLYQTLSNYNVHITNNKPPAPSEKSAATKLFVVITRNKPQTSGFKVKG